MSSNIRIEKTCLFCGELFIARTTVTKHCSDDCAKRAYKKKKRREKIQKVESKGAPYSPGDNVDSKVFLSVKEAVKLLGTSRWTIYRMIERKELKSAKFGRRTIIKKADIENLFQYEGDIKTKKSGR